MEDLQVDLVQEPGQAKDMGLFKRIIGVILSPQETMQYLALKPTIWFPLLLVALSQPVYVLARFPLYQEFVRRQFELGIMQSGQPVPPESIDMVMKYATYSGLAFMPVGSIIGWLILALIFFLAIKIFKGEGSFKQYASVTGYSYVIALLYLCISLPVSFVTGNLYLDSSLANISNIFLPGLKGSFWYGVIRGLDLFTIWQYVVMGTGIMAVSKINRSKVFLIIAIIFAASVLIGASGLRFM